MADRIYTSKKSEEILENLHYATKLEINTLARIAFCLSLKKTGTVIQRSEDTSGKQIYRGSFFGDDDLFIKTILFTIYGERVDDEVSANSRLLVIKDHIDNGCILLDEIFQKSNKDELKFFEILFYQIKAESGGIEKENHDALKLILGINELTNQIISVELNKTERHVNPHLAIVGKPGGGKTQFLLKILADIRKSSRFNTNFIFFDYRQDP